MRTFPESVGISLCERVLQDLFRRDAITLVNVHNGISSHAFPTLVPVVYAFAQIKATDTAFSYQFKVYDPKRNVISESNPGQVEALTNPNALHKIISAFSGLIFQEPGTYRIALEVENKEIDSMPFIVELLTTTQSQLTPTAAPAAAS